MKTLAIDVGGTKFTLGCFDETRLVLRASFPTDRAGGPEAMVCQIRETVGNWRKQYGFAPERCGIGFGGPVDFPSQTITLSTHVQGWAGFPLLDEIESYIGVRPVVDNDANTGALGEAHFGAGFGFDPIFYMTLSTGIGGGIVLGGHVCRGADCYAGEIGHMNIVPDGPACLCGSKGCFERMCCGLWLERDFGHSAQELLAQPDFVNRYVVLLARGLKVAIMLLNPARIIIGGGISKAGDKLFTPLRAELRRQITAWSRARLDVVPAQLDDDSVLYGALVLTAAT